MGLVEGQKSRPPPIRGKIQYGEFMELKKIMTKIERDAKHLLNCNRIIKTFLAVKN